jgi:hypothetical protein
MPSKRRETFYGVQDDAQSMCLRQTRWLWLAGLRRQNVSGSKGNALTWPAVWDRSVAGQASPPWSLGAVPRLR